MLFLGKVKEAKDGVHLGDNYKNIGNVTSEQQF